MNHYSQDLNDTVNEAMNVRKELENIMQEAIGISASLVNDFEDKLKLVNNNIDLNLIPDSALDQNNKEEIAIKAEEKSRPIETEEPSIEPAKIRVYELARNLDMPSKELLNIIEDLGIKVHNHMNMLDEEQVCLIRQVIDKKIIAEQDIAVITSFNSDQLPEEPARKDNVLDLLVGYKANAQQDDLEGRITNHEYIELTRSDDIIEEPDLGFSIAKIKSAHPYIAVNTLHEKGYSVREIAKLLDRGQGEVSLILNLAKRKQAVI